MQRIQSIAYANAMLGFAISGELGFEALNLWAEDELPGFGNAPIRSVKLIFEFEILQSQIKKRDVHPVTFHWLSERSLDPTLVVFRLSHKDTSSRFAATRLSLPIISALLYGQAH